MKLEELLIYNDIVVQCHDNPDADAIGSGFGLYTYFKEHGKNVRFVYGGKFSISKSNLKLMVKELSVPIEYVQTLDAPELLLTCDCQYGQGNVTRFDAKTVAVIDHHQVTVELPALSEVRSNIGSCSTIVWKMLQDEGVNVNGNTGLATALYYGLLTDTNNLTEVSHPLDRDMIDQIRYNNSAIVHFRNSNISREELLIAGNALLGYDYNETYRYAVVKTEPCDPNILGIISDMLLEVDAVDNCLVYSILKFGVKISVRSCTREAKANELAEFIAEGCGNGGGHLVKAGGFLQREKLEAAGVEYTEEGLHAYMSERMLNYFAGTEIIYANDYTADISGMRSAFKKRFSLGYVEASKLFPEGHRISVRTMEGDVDILIKNSTYIMIGVDGEIYPIERAKFEERYEYSDEPYSCQFEYEPSVKDLLTGKSRSILPFARSCVSVGTAEIYAAELDHTVKVFTAWDPDKYYLGRKGDYLAAQQNDLSDVYIINRGIFEKTYEFKG